MSSQHQEVTLPAAKTAVVFIGDPSKTFCANDEFKCVIYIFLNSLRSSFK